jgi:DNA repair protein RadC
MAMPAEDRHRGHRQRLREKFVKSGLSGFHDYEIVELLLTLASPRKDCKPQAKAAVKKFKNLRGVLAASPEELQQIEGIGPNNALGIKLVSEVAREFLKQKTVVKPAYKSAKEIFDYLYHSMRDLKKEVFKVIYLDSQNQIIDIADVAAGTVDRGAVSSREVMESAIGHGAAALILAHNHPSGKPEPSPSDEQLTRDLVFAGGIMQIRVLDHIVIGDNRYYSFAVEGLIEKYEGDFLDLKLKGVSEAKRRLYRAKVLPPEWHWRP